MLTEAAIVITDVIDYYYRLQMLLQITQIDLNQTTCLKQMKSLKTALILSHNVPNLKHASCTLHQTQKEITNLSFHASVNT